MKQNAKQLRQLIESAQKILVISHISPDPDALCSILLTGTTLKSNFPDKDIRMNSEELTNGLDFLAGYAEIRLSPLLDAVSDHQPDLIIMVDAMNFGRCTRADAETIKLSLKTGKTQLVIIDHHQPEGIEENDLYINNGSPAATQDIYELFFEDMGLNKPEGYAQTTLLGIVSDTNRFMYDNPRHRQTFAIVNDLLDAGGSIEHLENMRTRFTKNELLVFSELASNTVAEKGYTYTFVSDEFKKDWFTDGNTQDELKLGCQVFVNDYIRNIGDNRWGFLAYPDILGGEDMYSVSFRSVSGVKDVAALAKKLGGGGHKESAGVKFQASSIRDAVQKVKAVII